MITIFGIAAGIIIIGYLAIAMLVRVARLEHELEFLTRQYKNIYTQHGLIYDQYVGMERQYKNLMEIYRELRDIYKREHPDEFKEEKT